MSRAGIFGLFFSLFLLVPGLIPNLAHAQNSANKTLKIGVITCLSGEFAKMGKDAADAIQLAAEELEKQNQQLKVELFIEDDSFNATKTRSAFQKLLSFNKIDALIAVSSSVSSSVGSEIRKLKLPTAHVFLENESFDDSIVQVCPNMDQAEAEFGQYVKIKTQGKALLVVPADKTWIKLANGFEAGYGPGIIREELAPQEYDFRSLTLRIRKSGVKRVVLILGPEQGPLLLRELLLQLPKDVQFAFDANFLSGLAEYQKNNPDLSRIFDAPVLTLPGMENAEFRQRFQKRFGRDAGPWTEFSYDAYQVLLSAYNQDKQTWTNNMLSYNAEGLSGHLAFGPKGIRTAKTLVKTVKEVIAETKK